MSVTIPREMHENMVKQWMHEYETEFGTLDALINFSTAGEWAAHYAKLIRFWQTKTPEIDMDRRPNLKLLCAHAIATNGERAMWKVVKDKGLEAEVRAELSD